MALKYLGYPIDIHSGGKEHIPIHHENEIAQSEAATDQKFVNYWLHLEHLVVDGRKMSKSLGNVYTVTPNRQFDSIVDHGFDPLDLRLFYLQSHYQTAQNFTWQNLEAARNLRIKLYRKLESDFNITDLKQFNDINGDFLEEAERAVADNINTPELLEVVSRLSNHPNKAEKISTMVKLDELLGLDILRNCNRESNRSLIRSELDRRQQMKKDGDFVSADLIKESLVKKFGIEIVDERDTSGWVERER
jgi:cysteinyl-tRNA synthetase